MMAPKFLVGQLGGQRCQLLREETLVSTRFILQMRKLEPTR